MKVITEIKKQEVKLKVVNNIETFYELANRNCDELILLNNEKCIDNVTQSFESEKIFSTVEEYTSEYNTDQSDIHRQLLKKSRNDVLDYENLVVVCGNDINYLVLGYYHTLLNNAEFAIVEDFTGVVDLIQVKKSKFYTFVVPKENMSVMILNELQLLQNKQNNDAENSFYYGFLVAKDIYILNSLILKNYIYKQEAIKNYLIINRRDYIEENICENEDVTCLTYRTALTDIIEPKVCKEPVDAMTIIGHGRDDIIWLTDGCICGASKYKNDKSDNSESGLPICAYQERCLFNHGKILHVYDIKARHIFVNTCKSSKLEECVFDERYNTVYSFIEGHGISHIGCNGNIEGKDASNFYYVAQLRAGVPLGVIVSNLSQMYQDKGFIMSEYYQLLGDPTFKESYDGKKIRYSISEIDDSGCKNTFTFNIPNNVEIISIKLPIDNFAQKFYTLEWRMWVYLSSGQKLYGAFACDEGASVLELFSAGPINSGQTLSVNIVKDNKFRAEYIFNFTKLLDVGLTDNVLKLPITEAKEACEKLFGCYKLYMNELDTIYKNVYKKIDKLYNRIPKLSKAIAEYLFMKTQDGGYCWEEANSLSGAVYDSYYGRSEDEVCSNCGKQAYYVSMKHIYNSNIKRIRYYCPVCGFLKDVPHGKQLRFEFLDDVTAGKETDCSQTILVKNFTSAEVTGYGAIAIASGKNNKVKYPNNLIEINIKPKDSMEVNFKLKFSDETKPHQYWLECYFILNGNIYILERDIWLKDF